MIDLLGNAAAAVRAHTRGFMLRAQNVANAATEGIESQGEPRPVAQPEFSGVESDVTRGAPGKSADLPQEIAGMTSEQRAFEAGVAGLRTADEMVGSFIDIFV